MKSRKGSNAEKLIGIERGNLYQGTVNMDKE